ncbi:CBS domain-containing protein [Aromatoleum toluvorans]|uniref:CBS domain-containing protein n=2 Tax=Aromatoleum toluvorans TaxID=92002 RepID=A0ABX1PZ51_9RHOO|nr:CBS domain-containing protein [Aromatoleum toluvorans]
MSWLRAFVPAPHAVSRRERIAGVLGALIGLSVTEWIGRAALGQANPWFIAPMGASAVLLFAVPSSPLAQPWSIMVGNVLAALVGVTCAKLVGHPGLAGALAVAITIGAMFRLRCLHPPGGAVALTSVLGGPAVTDLGYGFALWPVGVDSLCLLAIALAFNAAAGRRYPHRHVEQAHPHGTADPLPSARVGVTPDDLQAVLEARGEWLDVSNDDLEEIIVAAEARAYRRRMGEIRCADIMAADVVTVSADAPIATAWALLARHRVKALPVVSAGGRLAGMVTLHDFFVQGNGSPRARIAEYPGGDVAVRELMSPRVVTARPEQSIDELVGVFSDAGLHHVPVVGVGDRVIGMVTQSDLIAALARMRLEEPAANGPAKLRAVEQVRMSA